MRKVLLKHVKEGSFFKRKENAKSEFIRNHYNRKSWLNGFANYSCTNDDTGSEIFLKPTTLVWVDS